MEGASDTLSLRYTAFDNAWTKARLADWRPEGQPNPFVVGADTCRTRRSRVR